MWTMSHALDITIHNVWQLMNMLQVCVDDQNESVTNYLYKNKSKSPDQYSMFLFVEHWLEK